MAEPAPRHRGPIGRWDTDVDALAKPPKGHHHAVLDTPAGLHGGALKDVLKMADKVIVPLQPSIFDIYATQAFLDKLREHRHAAGVQVGIVGMRIDSAPARPSNCTTLWKAWACRAGLCARHAKLCASGGPGALGV